MPNIITKIKISQSTNLHSHAIETLPGPEQTHCTTWYEFLEDTSVYLADHKLWMQIPVILPESGRVWVRRPLNDVTYSNRDCLPLSSI